MQDMVYVVSDGDAVVAAYTNRSDAQKDVKILGRNGKVTLVSLRQKSIKEL